MSTPTTRAAWLYPRRYLWKTSEKAMALQLDGATRLYPIIGDPIIYARSPTVFSAGLAARGRNALCVPLEAPDGALDAVMQCLGASRNVDGILVTMPHKFTTFPYCATVTDTSRLLRVVSVLRRNRDGGWHGDMSGLCRRPDRRWRRA